VTDHLSMCEVLGLIMHTANINQLIDLVITSNIGYIIVGIMDNVFDSHG
jgi:hypothetical protein